MDKTKAEKERKIRSEALNKWAMGPDTGGNGERATATFADAIPI